MAVADSPISGTWTNSYCSQLDLSVDEESGRISGTYTSHTGATGSYNVVGSVAPLGHREESGDPPNGRPVALAIQWRAINVSVADADGTWHWVSNLAGQYHPAQSVDVPGQKSYEIPETLELLNALIATATAPPLAASAPITWPQTLDFFKQAPEFCEPVTPPKPVPFTGSGKDLVSGTWEADDGSRLVLQANIDDGTVSGSYESESGTFGVEGLFDNFSKPLPDVVVAEQGVSVAIADGRGSLAGGVDVDETAVLRILVNRLTSTTWTGRFAQGDVDSIVFRRIGE